MYVKLVEVTRGEVVESTHRGNIVAIDSKGDILFERGDPSKVSFFRSTSKPFQAIIPIKLGVVEKYGLTSDEIALIAASHSGDEEHIKVLLKAMKKAGISHNMLKCGVHEPLEKEASLKLRESGQKPTELHCNCSGKHLGLILAAMEMGANIEDYFKTEHPVQKEIREVLSDFSNIDVLDIKTGVDGCGVPVYALPLKNIALSYANLCNPDFLDGRYRDAQAQVIDAMVKNPNIVAGKGRIDTELMKNFGDRLICKIGEEGVYALGLKGTSTGIAIKIEDGNIRAIGPVVVELLIRLGVIKKEEVKNMKELCNPDILNHKREKVGEIRAVFN